MTPDNGFAEQTRSNWIRLRTLIVLRWVAILGQIIAVIVALAHFKLQLPLGWITAAICGSVITNLVTMFVYPANKRLSEQQTVMMLLFDTAQLLLLIFLTGGLNNPFSVLILAPVTISATVLTLRSTVLLGFVSLAVFTLVSVYHVPLKTADGYIYQLPDLFLFGFWLALTIGTLFLAFYARRVSTEIHSMSDALVATQMALAREQKLTDLGGVVAAAAHELGTPLATIKLVAAEMADDLPKDSEMVEDARLIGDQADRCREILRGMGRAGKDDLHLRHAPLEAVIREAAEPHLQRGKSIQFALGPAPSGSREQPVVRRHPEVIHGLRNLVQNAVDFSKQSVWVDVAWTQDRIQIRISDDGAGFSPQVISRIGDPFVKKRAAGEKPRRPGYEGMGLGLFIAKTLLERTGAEISFANGSDPFLTKTERPARSGAVVEVVWPMDRLVQSEQDEKQGLGENIPFAP